MASDRRDLGRKVLVHNNRLAGVYSYRLVNHSGRWMLLTPLLWCYDVATLVSSFDITTVVAEASWTCPQWMKDATVQKLFKVQSRQVRS